MVNWSSFSGSRLPFFSMTLPMEIRPSTGGVIARPLSMVSLLEMKKGQPRSANCMDWPRGGKGCCSWVSADQEAPCTRFQQWVLGLQVRLFFEQLRDVEADTVFGLAPGDVTVGELRPASIAHGLLQHLL